MRFCLKIVARGVSIRIVTRIEFYETRLDWEKRNTSCIAKREKSVQLISSVASVWRRLLSEVTFARHLYVCVKATSIFNLIEMKVNFWRNKFCKRSIKARSVTNGGKGKRKKEEGEFFWVLGCPGAGAAFIKLAGSRAFVAVRDSSCLKSLDYDDSKKVKKIRYAMGPTRKNEMDASKEMTLFMAPYISTSGIRPRATAHSLGVSVHLFLSLNNKNPPRSPQEYPTNF